MDTNTEQEENKNNTFNLIKFLFYKEGRINRRIYFAYTVYFTIFSSLINLPFELLGMPLGQNFSILNVIILIPIFYMSLILMIKRLHDLDKSAWFLLLMIIPFINIWLMYILIFKKGNEEVNKFGNNPESTEQYHKLPLSFKITIPLFIIITAINIIVFIKIGGGMVGIKMDQSLSQIKNTLPKMIGENLRLNNIWRERRTLNYEFQITDRKKETINTKYINTTVKEKIIKTLCNKQFSKELMLDGGQYKYIYYDMNNLFVTDILITNKECISN
ncbi:MAG: DUF805 domain-containing protein [Arcobacteraceae bacterium]|nr:DUF805 domain-containing protein [Arcobacteraceae bacterium]